MKFSFVIPTYDKFGLTSDLLMDIYQKCQSTSEVLVVDNGSKEWATQEGFHFWSRIQPFHLKVARLEENVGFLRAANYGLKKATGDVIALISNDVRIHKDVIRLTSEIFEAFGDKILLGGRLLDWDTGWNCFNGKIYPYVEGWALIATRSAWEEFGYFDERYAPNDMEDVDLGATAASLGYKLMQFPPYYGEVMTHIGAQTLSYGDERMALTLKNKAKFEEKWNTKSSEGA